MRSKRTPYDSLGRTAAAHGRRYGQAVTPKAITADGNRHLSYGDNLDILQRGIIPTDSVDLCYIDPPFNSKRKYHQIYNNIGEEDRAQAQAFIDTWKWDDRANEGYSAILSNEGGRFQQQFDRSDTGPGACADAGEPSGLRCKHGSTDSGTSARAETDR